MEPPPLKPIIENDQFVLWAWAVLMASVMLFFMTPTALPTSSIAFMFLLNSESNNASGIIQMLPLLKCIGLWGPICASL